jgi:hypothetical protein
LNARPIIRDQSYCVLRDGSLFSVHGDQDLDGLLLGDVAFAVDPDGLYTDGSHTYSKPYVHDSAHRHQKRKQPRVPSIDGIQLRIPGVGVDPGEIINVISVAEMRAAALEGPHASTIERLEHFAVNLVESETGAEVDFGLTGSVGLGLQRLDGKKPHDWDLVFSTDSMTGSAIVAALQRRAMAHPGTRVQEYGKGWLIRQWVGDDLLCPFFRGKEPHVLRLINVSSKPVTLVGRVTEAVDSASVPVRFSVRSESGADVSVVVLGLRSRGDIRIDDHVRVVGHWGAISIDNRPATEVLVSVDDAPRLLLSQPWPSYYA